MLLYIKYKTHTVVRFCYLFLSFLFKVLLYCPGWPWTVGCKQFSHLSSPSPSEITYLFTYYKHIFPLAYLDHPSICFFLFFIIFYRVLFNYGAGWGYIVKFTGVIRVCKLYHTWIHPNICFCWPLSPFNFGSHFFLCMCNMFYQVECYEW
jgi:hypothetical protein